MTPHDPGYTVVYSLEALAQLRALPGEARGLVQDRAEALARALQPGPGESRRQSFDTAGHQVVYELRPRDGSLRVVRIIARAGRATPRSPERDGTPEVG